MRSTSRVPALAAALALTLALGATAAHAGVGFGTVDCFVQCFGPPGNYFLSGMTIDDCCSYVSPDGRCFGTGYSVNGGNAQACEGPALAAPAPPSRATVGAPTQPVAPQAAGTHR